MKKSKQLKIGLALGSGGPKGLAHIGVIKILEENNIPIDFISGSSIGAMIGGFYAATKDVRQVEKVALDTDWKRIFSLIDPSLRQGLLNGDKVENFIESHINKINFENLKIPLSVIATDIKTCESIVLDKGEVASAIRASISFPLVFEPVKRKGKLLADGGLSLPVPVDIVRKMGADLVIAVNLDADYFTNGNNENINSGFYGIANNSINLLRHHLAHWNVGSADIVIAPQSGNVHWNKFLDGKNIILAGEKATKKVLPQLKNLLLKKQKSI